MQLWFTTSGGAWNAADTWYEDVDRVGAHGSAPTSGDDLVFDSQAGNCTISGTCNSQSVDTSGYNGQFTTVTGAILNLYPLESQAVDFRCVGRTATTPSLVSGSTSRIFVNIYIQGPGVAGARHLYPFKECLYVTDLYSYISISNVNLFFHPYDQGVDEADHKSRYNIHGELTVMQTDEFSANHVYFHGFFDTMDGSAVTSPQLGIGNISGTTEAYRLYVHASAPPAGMSVGGGLTISRFARFGVGPVTLQIDSGAVLRFLDVAGTVFSIDFNQGYLSIIGEDNSLFEMSAGYVRSRYLYLPAVGTSSIDLYDMTLREEAGVSGAGSFELSLGLEGAGGLQLYIRNKLSFKAVEQRFKCYILSANNPPTEGAGYAWVGAKEIDIQGRGSRTGIGGAVSADVELRSNPAVAGLHALISAETEPAPEWADFFWVKTTLKTKNGIDGITWDAGSDTCSDSGSNIGIVFSGTDWIGNPDWPVLVDDTYWWDPWPPQPEFEFTASFGGALPPSQVITITPESGALETLLRVLATSVPSWLSVITTGSGDLQYVTLRPKSTSLTPGTYTAAITLDIPNAIHGSRQHFISYTVNSVPEFELSEDPILFMTLKSDQPDQKVIEVLNKYPSADPIASPVGVGDVPPELDVLFVEDRVGARVGWLYVQPTQAAVDQDRDVYTYTFKLGAGSLYPGSLSSSSGSGESGQEMDVEVVLVLQAPILSVSDLTQSYISGSPNPTLRLYANNIGDFTMNQIQVGGLGAWLTVNQFGGVGDEQWVDLDVDVTAMVGDVPPVAQYQRTIDVWAPGAYAPGETQTSDLAPAQVKITIEWVEAPLFVANPDEVVFIPGEDWSFPPGQVVQLTALRGTPFEPVEVITNDPNYPIPVWLSFMLYDDAPAYQHQSLLLNLVDIPLTGDVQEYYATLKIKTRADLTDPYSYTATTYLYLPVSILPPAYLIRESCYIPYVRKLEGVLVDDCDLVPPPSPVVRCCPTINLPGPPGADGEDGADGESGVDGADGADGASGVDGLSGLSGESGQPGASG